VRFYTKRKRWQVRHQRARQQVFSFLSRREGGRWLVKKPINAAARARTRTV
jgi:hypothetical protein